MSSQVNHALLLYRSECESVQRKWFAFFTHQAYKRCLTDNYQKVKFHWIFFNAHHLYFHFNVYCLLKGTGIMYDVNNFDLLHLCCHGVQFCNSLIHFVVTHQHACHGCMYDMNLLSPPNGLITFEFLFLNRCIVTKSNLLLKHPRQRHRNNYA